MHRALYPLGALAGLLLAIAGAVGLIRPPEQMLLPIGLAGWPLHLRLDALAAFFLVLLGISSVGASLFAGGYLRRPQGAAAGLVALRYHLFLASMGCVLLADDAYGFLLAWEAMTLSSYFLVITDARIPAIRAAGYLYLLIAHLGALAVLVAFALLQRSAGQPLFDAMRAARPPAPWAALAYLLALAGFGAKAGLVPLHVWLPEAHPAAPSPVSALMSGAMLKVALYGFLRLSFDLLTPAGWWWGLAPLTLGLLGAVYGAVFAAVQTDIKRLLAYSSIENMGILFAGAGLALIFQSAAMPLLGALALLAVLYHALNHACMKSLLFLGSGAVLHATGERNMGRLGGLISRMPWVAWTSLVGVLALAGLPPLNGFVSEWLLLQAFLRSPAVPRAFVHMLLPLGAALLVLAVALAAYVMVKFYGVVFLGQPRERALGAARDVGLLERLGMTWLAAGCVLLGLLPAWILPHLTAVATQLQLGAVTLVGPWGSVVPLAAGSAAYSAPVFLAAILAAVLLSAGAVWLLYRRRVRRGPAWDCGFGALDSRMQDTAEGFGQPIRRIFAPFFAIQRELPTPFDASPRYAIRVDDRCWRALYEPVGVLLQRASRAVTRWQPERIGACLLYGFVTLIALLAMVMWG